MIPPGRFFTVSLFLMNCAACANSLPDDLGLKDGKLPSCPDSPNCVSSQSEDVRHKIESLHYTTSLLEAQENLLTILRSMKRTTIIAREDHYIHATCASLLFRFVDDMEFYFVEEENIIHVRSASRRGYYDFGVNSRRIDYIRKHF